MQYNRYFTFERIDHSQIKVICINTFFETRMEFIIYYFNTL